MDFPIYKWQEDNIPPQVVFEILSPSNTKSEIERKLLFYDRYGVQEYYYI
ncbi:Uma2 family endonuclease [Trichormus azollae]